MSDVLGSRAMPEVDLNLLVALDALLAEGGVAGAARRLGLSASAVSRPLARLRAATGDPLLVRAGRGLVPTPRAVELRERVRDLAQEARAVLRPAAGLDLAALERTFTVRANEGFVETFAARLVAAVTEAAPGVRLRFAPKPDKDVRPLREGLVDLDVGVLGATGPEVRVQALFRDRFVGVVRDGHPLLGGEVTPERYAACGHAVASRRGRDERPGGRGPGGARPCPHGRRRGAGLPGGGGGGSRLRPGGARAGAAGGGGVRGHAELPAAGAHGADHGLADVAPAPGRRPGPPLAARPGAGGLPGAGTTVRPQPPGNGEDSEGWPASSRERALRTR